MLKLSPTQLAMLCIIDDATVWDNGVVKRYWSPHDRTERYTDVAGNRAEFYVYGAGVVAAIKSLDKKGLTARYRDSGYDAHARYITESGRVYIEELRSAARPNRVW